MLKAEINRNNSKPCVVECLGSLNEIASDVINLIRCIVQGIDRDDHTHAMIFEAMIQGEISNGILDKYKNIVIDVVAAGTGRTTDEALNSLLDDLRRQAGKE